MRAINSINSTRFLFLITIMVSIACSQKKVDREENLKMQQYMIQGKQLYMQHCSACHQEDGAGLAQLFPPVNKSDYMENNLDNVACIIRYGIREPLTVNGVTFTQPMPGNPSLTNLEIAEILTYIYNSGEHERGLIGVRDVDSFMAECRK